MQNKISLTESGQLETNFYITQHLIRLCKINMQMHEFMNPNYNILSIYTILY